MRVMLHSAKMADVRPRPSKELTHRSRGQGLEFGGSEDWYGSSLVRLGIVAELQRGEAKSKNATLAHKYVRQRKWHIVTCPW